MYWFDRWRERPRIRVSVVNEWPSQDGEVRVELEVENLSNGPNSLVPEILMDGWSPRREHKHSFFSITADSPRHLPPLTPVRVTATESNRASGFHKLWFRRYRISATRGRPRIICLRWIGGRPLSAVRAVIERTLFRRFGRGYHWLFREALRELEMRDV